MADVHNQATPAAAKAPAKKSSTGKLIGIVGVLLGVGLGGWWMFVRPHTTAKANDTEANAATVILPLESFTVNLADPEEGRFLRATMALGVDGQLPAIAKGENKPVETGQVSMATIRDSIITVLAQCTSDQLLSPAGKAKLKADIIASLNHDVPDLHVREVYFTEFLVQR